MTTFVISAFPGCGKSYCYKNLNGKGLSILDSDSSEFSWVKDSDGNNTKERNPNFPQNYMDHIKKNIGKVDIIFASSHEVVRKALKQNNISTIIVYPAKEMKDIFIERYKNRGNDEGFIDFISSNWDNFIDDISTEDFGFLKERLDNKNPYLDYKFLCSIFDNWNGNMSSLWLN